MNSDQLRVSGTYEADTHLWHPGTPTDTVVAPDPVAGNIAVEGSGRGPSTNVPANIVVDSPQSGILGDSLKPRLPETSPIEHGGPVSVGDIQVIDQGTGNPNGPGLPESPNLPTGKLRK